MKKIKVNSFLFAIQSGHLQRVIQHTPHGCYGLAKDEKSKVCSVCDVYHAAIISMLKRIFMEKNNQNVCKLYTLKL